MICTRSLLMWTLALNSSDPAERALPACSFQQLHYFRPTSARNFEKTTESQPGWAKGPGGTRAAVKSADKQTGSNQADKQIQAGNSHRQATAR